MSKRPLNCLTVAAAALGLLLWGGTAPACASRSPGEGPDTGGTEVVLAAPIGLVFSQVSAGSTHTLALDDAGKLYSWGDNEYGQLGDGSTTSRDTPVQVLPPQGVRFVQIDASRDGSMALGDDGNAYAWGLNISGRFGYRSPSQHSVPTLVPGLAGVAFVQVSMSDTHALAIGSDGNTYGWGGNTFGQLGDGRDHVYSSLLTPVVLPDAVRFVDVALRGGSSTALGDNGKVYAWGNVFSTLYSTPKLAETPDGLALTEIASGGFHVSMIGDDGGTYAWGLNEYGQLGDDTTVDRRSAPVPVLTPPGVSFTQTAGGFLHSAAIGDDGNAYTWGYNAAGQLGDGGTAARNAPAKVELPAGASLVQISAGNAHTVALDERGNAYAWGDNSHGQLGTGATGDENRPVQVSTPPVTVTAVSFDEEYGDDLTDNGDGTIQVRTPAHAPGVVDVVVEWEQNGEVQQPVRYPAAFTYLLTTVAPTVTNPAHQSVLAGDTATFEVQATGMPVPDVAWEASADQGRTWSPTVASAAASLSEDSRVLTVRGSRSNNGVQYRAVASNTAGTVLSEAATLEVRSALKPTTPPSTPPSTPPTTPPKVATPQQSDSNSTNLVKTGQTMALVVWVAAALTVSGAVVSTLALRARNRTGQAGRANDRV
ncbi:alpha-tubulin suppressor-like RCC1 family protein [Leucobacter luti]|uniref:RCC1 domain-containing protein n=1 Tax=Leucobacter luti TaxID=340320 RepID=UPI001051200C|nr:hypothetical protein [Leucobacter luti]MCW2289038.1 alpha-tubulin suppressor-like RCC1 family protein [Leucobacter luti]TCK35561.1 alpha-tubulin suppressor-like RCC1 family protein [Leucobacter luti]